MGQTGIPALYTLFNYDQTKNIVLVVKINGLNDVLSSRELNTRVLYGDPGIFYGDAGLVYGGLRPYSVYNQDGSLSVFRDLLSLDGSSLTISQRLEPEQGRASVSTLSLSFIDKQQYMTQLISAGVLLPEILGAEIEVFLGFVEISYPQDFLRIFRGYVSGIDDGPGSVQIQISDPNIKRRQQLFYISATALTADIGPTDTSIFVVNTGGFFAPILGPDATYSLAIHCYILIDSEWIECAPDVTDITKFNVIHRGARGTTADVHTATTAVAAGIQVGDSLNPENAIDMALKIMLSGWGGPWVTGIDLFSIGPSPDPSPFVVTTSFILLPSKVDAVSNYGLVEGDWVELTGSSFAGNNGTFHKIIRFADYNGESNRAIYLDAVLTKEQSTPAKASFRSQYDVYPTEAGLRLSPADVDIARHLFIKNTFLGQAGNDLIFFITSPESSGKDFLETQVYFPIGAYSYTRRGKLSCGYHAPPIANQDIVYLDNTNIVTPEKIHVGRALNNRAFFNEIDLSYDYDDAGNPLSIYNTLDSDSYELIGISNVLSIAAKGVYSGYSSNLLKKRSFFLLNRYKRGAIMISNLTVNWQAGSVIEAGDIVAVNDPGTIQIANLNNGKRGIGNQLFEVIDRSFDIKSGNTTLKLVGGVGASTTDRFATVSPSSIIDVGSTNTTLIIKDSFGALYPGDESKKWINYVGLPVLVHSPDYSIEIVTTLKSIDLANIYELHVSDMGVSPPAGYIVDIARYPTSADPTVNAFYKIMHVYLSPTVYVVTGIDNKNFTVPGGDFSKFFLGSVIRVHAVDFSSDSKSVIVTALDSGTNTVTVGTSLGFTPSAGFQVEEIGFPDQGPTYRLI